MTPKILGNFGGGAALPETISTKIKTHDSRLTGQIQNTLMYYHYPLSPNPLQLLTKVRT
jgi:hypothetical protein